MKKCLRGDLALIWLDRDSIEESDRRYILDYGEEKCAKEFLMYEDTLPKGKDWMDAFLEIKASNENYSLKEFHKNVVLKAIKTTK